MELNVEVHLHLFEEKMYAMMEVLELRFLLLKSETLLSLWKERIWTLDYPKTRSYGKNIIAKEGTMQLSVFVFPLRFQLMLFTDVLASLSNIQKLLFSILIMD